MNWDVNTYMSYDPCFKLHFVLNYELWWLILISFDLFISKKLFVEVHKELCTTPWTNLGMNNKCYLQTNEQLKTMICELISEL